MPRGTSRQRSLEWLKRREKRRKKRNPVAEDLQTNGPCEKTHRPRSEKRRKKISIYDWDVLTDYAADE